MFLGYFFWTSQNLPSRQKCWDFHCSWSLPSTWPRRWRPLLLIVVSLASPVLASVVKPIVMVEFVRSLVLMEQQRELSTVAIWTPTLRVARQWWLVHERWFKQFLSIGLILQFFWNKYQYDWHNWLHIHWKSKIFFKTPLEYQNLT